LIYILEVTVKENIGNPILLLGIFNALCEP
jgi:hypothetical protein